MRSFVFSGYLTVFCQAFPLLLKKKPPTKDTVRNYFPNSLDRGKGSVVPLGEVIVEKDFHILLESVGVLATGGIDAVQYSDNHLEAATRLRFLHKLSGDLHRMKDDPLARPGNMRKHAVLDRIMLRTIRRVMGHPQFDAQPIRQSLQVFLEQVVRRAVAAAAIAQNQQAVCLRVGGTALFLPPQSDAVAANKVRPCRARC